MFRGLDLLTQLVRVCWSLFAAGKWLRPSNNMNGVGLEAAVGAPRWGNDPQEPQQATGLLD